MSLKRLRWVQVETVYVQFCFWESITLHFMIPHLPPSAEKSAAEMTSAADEAFRTWDINTPVILQGGEPVLPLSSAS